MTDSRPVIALIGCGRMGSALLRGWLAGNTASAVHVVEPAGLPPSLEMGNTVQFYANADELAGRLPPHTVIVLAVKPQIMEKTCAALAPVLPADALIVSIAAGQTLAGFEKRFGAGHAIIRTMPNTPAAIGKGITVAVAGATVSPAQKATAETALRPMGAVEWVSEEGLLDPVTALSGSGPAYVFLLIETLAKAGERAGLPAALAMKLARQTVIGSAALAEAEAATPAATLRENVTSPGGTTVAALSVLMDGKLQKIFDEALAAASARSHELSR